MTDQPAVHPALVPGHVAVVTGAASGIGLAAATDFARRGLKVVLADIDAGALQAAAAGLADRFGADAVLAVPTDVARIEAVEALRAAALARFGAVDVLMANAGIEGGGGMSGDLARWRQIIDVNLMGVVFCLKLFADAIAVSGRPGAIIVTGSKQGITMPPGDSAYNISKAGVKAAAEAFAHELRNRPGAAASVHLLIPGFTFTGFTRVRTSEKPAGAWTPEQVVDFMTAAMAKGDFYILCPDNEVSRALDEKRIAWAAGDIIENRPPLSRWHDDHKAAFAAFLTRERPALK